MAKVKNNAGSKKEVKKADAARKPCLCGCGGFPKGKHTRFLPGHDSRLRGKKGGNQKPKPKKGNNQKPKNGKGGKIKK